MITHENVGFETMDGYLGQAGPSYLSVIVIDSADGPPLPGAALRVSYGGKTYGGNTNDNGTAVIATDAPPGTSLDVSAQYPGYANGVMSITTSANPNASPMGIPMDKLSTPAPTPVAQPTWKVPTPYNPKPIVPPAAGYRPTPVALATTSSNLPMYLALGGIGVAALILIVLIATSK